jgi:hypothetical protein
MSAVQAQLRRLAVWFTVAHRPVAVVSITADAFTAGFLAATA